MGHNQSIEIDPSVEPLTLRERSLKAVAEYIKSPQCRNIILAVGAGISTSAGIPDFRSPDTGIYSKLAELDLPDPESVFELGFFKENPHPFYALAHDLYPGKFRPTITHSFINLLNEKGLLQLCFTQNIDTLERAAGVPPEKVVEAHGSFASQRCIECKTPYPDDLMKQHVEADPPRVPTCPDPDCGGYIKPDIVFFGEPLPETFFTAMLGSMADASLVIVMGSSLTVYPFASVPGSVLQTVPRLLINNQRVGDFGSRADDVILVKDCDEGVRMLCRELGWLEELEEMWAETAPKKTQEEIEKEEREKNVPLKERLEEEVEKMAKDVEKGIEMAKRHKARVEGQLDKLDAKISKEQHELPQGQSEAESSRPLSKAFDEWKDFRKDLTEPGRTAPVDFSTTTDDGLSQP